LSGKTERGSYEYTVAEVCAGHLSKQLVEFSNFHFVQAKMTLFILSNIFINNKSKVRRLTQHVTEWERKEIYLIF